MSEDVQLGSRGIYVADEEQNLPYRVFDGTTTSMHRPTRLPGTCRGRWSREPGFRVSPACSWRRT